MRNPWAAEFPVGDPCRGAPYGERLDPSTVGLNIPAGQGSAAGLSTLGSAMQLIGAFTAGRQARSAGDKTRTAAYYDAAQLDQNAGQQIAAAQRQALEERRRATLVASRGLAVAAANGGASDPTVANLLADIEGEGVYRAGIALYGGEEKARSLRAGAATRRFEGDIAAEGGRQRQQAYTITGFGNAAASAATLYGKYGMGGPKKVVIDPAPYDYGRPDY